MEIGSSLSDIFFGATSQKKALATARAFFNAVFYAGERNSFAVSAGNRFYSSLFIIYPRRLPKSPGVHFIFSRACSFYCVYSLYLSAMLLPMSTPMTDAIIRPLVQPLESPRQWSPLTFVSKFSSILMRLE